MSELHALLGVRRHCIESALRPAGASSGKSESPRIQDMNGDTEPPSEASQQMIGGNLEVLEIQLRLRRSTDTELPHRSHNRESGHVGANQKRCRPLSSLAAPLKISLSKRRDDSGTMRIADPDLPAIELPLRAVLAETRGRLDVLRVGSDIGLGQRVRGEILSARQCRQIPLLLLLAAVEHDRLRPPPAVNTDEY